MGEANVHPPYPKPSLPKPAKGALKRPRPLKNKRMLFPGQAWAADVTHIPIGGRVRRSMDGGARWGAFAIVERWFRSLKCECVKVGEYPTPWELRKLIGDYVNQYNNRRLHESLGHETPASWCYSGIAASRAAWGKADSPSHPIFMSSPISHIIRPDQRFKIEASAGRMDHLDDMIARCELELYVRMRPHWAAVELLCGIPGITGLSASLVLSEIGFDMSQFEQSEVEMKRSA